jgi:hypothetical protein
LVDCFSSFFVIGVLSVMNRRRSRASVNRSQAGIRSRRRRPGAVVTPRASGLPLHESSSDAQSAKTGSDPTAAHGLSAVRLLQAAVFQCSQSATMRRLRHLSTPTYPQRTRLRVICRAPNHLHLPAHRHVGCHGGESLSYFRWAFPHVVREYESTNPYRTHELGRGTTLVSTASTLDSTPRMTGILRALCAIYGIALEPPSTLAALLRTGGVPAVLILYCLGAQPERRKRTLLTWFGSIAHLLLVFLVFPLALLVALSRLFS